MLGFACVVLCQVGVADTLVLPTRKRWLGLPFSVVRLDEDRKKTWKCFGQATGTSHGRDGVEFAVDV